MLKVTENNIRGSYTKSAPGNPRGEQYKGQLYPSQHFSREGAICLLPALLLSILVFFLSRNSKRWPVAFSPSLALPLSLSLSPRKEFILLYISHILPLCDLVWHLNLVKTATQAFAQGLSLPSVTTYPAPRPHDNTAFIK